MRYKQSSFRLRTGGAGAIALTALALAGCATGDPPAAELATASTAVDRAAASPQIATAAPVEMQSARDKLARAQHAMGSKDYEDARRLAEQAEVDARIAESKVAATRSEQALRELQESIRELNREIDRRSAVPATSSPAAVGTVGSPVVTPAGTSVVRPAAGVPAAGVPAAGAPAAVPMVPPAPVRPLSR